MPANKGDCYVPSDEEENYVNPKVKAKQEANALTPKAETKLIDDKTVGLFTKQMKDWGYESKEEFANEIVKHQIGDVVNGKKVTKLLKERAQLIIEA
jgi:hypothetical protein